MVELEIRPLMLALISGGPPSRVRAATSLKVALRVASRHFLGKAPLREDHGSVTKLKQTLKIEKSLLEALEKVPPNPELREVLQDMRKRIKQTEKWIGQAKLLQLMEGK
jgi:hypothetical protein